MEDSENAKGLRLFLWDFAFCHVHPKPTESFSFRVFRLNELTGFNENGEHGLLVTGTMRLFNRE